jgi:hypothetical protein
MSSELAEKIINVPKLYEAGDRSTACLLKDVGFPDRHQALSVEEVETVLERDPRLADLWLKRSRDQRVAGGWGIERKGDVYRVVNFSDGRAMTVRGRVHACAEFVVRYVSFIGDVLARTH